MKNFLYICILFLSLSAFSQDLWIQRDSLNGPPRSNAAAFVIENDGYVVSGYDGSSRKRSMVSYDPEQDDWDNEESLGNNTGDGLNRSSAMSFSAHGLGFVCMGEGNSFIFSDLWMYDKYTETWTQMANFPGEPRTQGISFEMDNIGFVGLGKASDFATYLNDLWSYDYLANAWTQVSNFPGSSRVDAIGVAMGGKAYIGLGRDSTSFPVDIYEYYPANDTWQQIADFPGTPRINATSFARFPQLFVTTGDDGFNYLNDTWEYNYFGDSWSQKSNFPGAGRAGCISMAVNDRYFVGAGFGNGEFYDDFYEYTFALGIADQNVYSISSFPNPSNGNFTLQISGINEPLNFILYDINGKEISFDLEQIDHELYQFSLNQVEKGTYFIQIASKTEVISVQSIILL